jgi:hypothetical protein
MKGNMEKSIFNKKIQRIRKFQDYIDKTEESIDEFVWKIFHLYIENKKINFNEPRTWTVEDNCIYFDGLDGCMGIYDNMTLRIPLEYFTEDSVTLMEMEMEMEKIEKEKQEKIRLERLEQFEKKELERLQKKYENT